MSGHGSPDAGTSTPSNDVIYLHNTVLRRAFASSSARFLLGDPCQRSSSVSDVLESRNLRQDIARISLLTSFRDLIGQGDSFGDCLCGALELAADFSLTIAVPIIALSY